MRLKKMKPELKRELLETMETETRQEQPKMKTRLEKKGEFLAENISGLRRDVEQQL